MLKYIVIARWLQLSPDEVRNRLPPTKLAAAGHTPFRVLQEQVDTLLSSIASDHPDLIARLTNEIQNPSSVEDALSDENWLREHDINAAISVLKNMFFDQDFRLLHYHELKPLSWLWKEVKLVA